MNSRVLLLGGLALAGLEGVGGCVYYNGMYNANRLARSARKAEREGRTFDASSLWGQVATKAESVLVRHPTSKYAAQAGLLRGVALARLGQCDQALEPLSRISTATGNSDLVEDGLIAAGRCHLVLGNLAAGDAAFSQVLNSKNADRRREARLQHARLLRQSGRYREALDVLAGLDDPRVQAERVLALAGTNRVPEALALTDSLMARGDTSTRRWDSLVVILADHNPVAASGMVEKLRRLPNQRPESQARMLVQDGLRLAEIDTARAARRFRQAIAIGGTGESAARASLALVRMECSRAQDPADLQRVMDTLRSLGKRFAASAEEAARLGATVAEVQQTATVITPGSPQGDLRLFLAGEAARDILAAPRLAEVLFRRIPEQWPFSPYAPKAILAAQQLNPGWIDSARILLDMQYYDSPYLATIRGEISPEYRVLEDSLGSFAAALAAAQAGSVRRKLPPTDDGRRPQPAPGGSRVPGPQ
jgi:tetratricopeptide (TPR) repeat protein